jgi:DNA-binding beta-propeller fold protein YncE
MATKKSSNPRPKTARRAKAEAPSKAAAPSVDEALLTLTERKTPVWGVLGTLVFILVLGFFGTILWHHRAGLTPAPAPSDAPHPAWGPEVKLEVVGQTEVPDQAQNIKVDADGRIYVLTQDSLKCYFNGKPAGSLDLKTHGEFMNMDFNGKDFYITKAYEPNVRKVPKDLSRVEKITEIPGAGSVLGIAAGPDGTCYVGSIETHFIYVLDPKGKVIRNLGGKTGVNCPVDMVLRSGGDLLVHDHLALQVIHLDNKGGIIAAWPVPWTSHEGGWERLCTIGDKIYISGYNDQRLFIEDMKGNNIAQCRKLSNGDSLDRPQMVGAGRDGFLYVQDKLTIYKLRPYVEPAPAADAKAAQ